MILQRPSAGVVERRGGAAVDPVRCATRDGVACTGTRLRRVDRRYGELVVQARPRTIRSAWSRAADGAVAPLRRGSSGGSLRASAAYRRARCRRCRTARRVGRATSPDRRSAWPPLRGGGAGGGGGSGRPAAGGRVVLIPSLGRRAPGAHRFAGRVHRGVLRRRRAAHQSRHPMSTWQPWRDWGPVPSTRWRSRIRQTGRGRPRQPGSTRWRCPTTSRAGGRSIAPTGSSTRLPGSRCSRWSAGWPGPPVNRWLSRASLSASTSCRLADVWTGRRCWPTFALLISSPGIGVVQWRTPAASRGFCSATAPAA